MIRRILASDVLGFTAICVATFLVGWIIACQDSISVTGPSSPATQTTTSVAPPTAPPRVDVPFTFDVPAGIILFAGARADEMKIRGLYSRLQTRLGAGAYPVVCGEVQSWPNDVAWLPRGVTARPFDETSPAYLELEHFLDVSARIDGAQVLVKPICNLKEDGTSPANREKWVRTVSRLASRYEHTALEVVNEWKHPASNITQGEIQNLLRTARAEFGGLIGTDDSVKPGDYVYNRALRGLVDYVSFHPCRTDLRDGGLKCGWSGGGQDPAPRDVRDIIEVNGGFAVLSETTAYDAGSLRLGGCCTEDRNQIIRYFRNCQAVDGCRFVYHCVECLAWPEMEITWIPPGS